MAEFIFAKINERWVIKRFGFYWRLNNIVFGFCKVVNAIQDFDGEANASPNQPIKQVEFSEAPASPARWVRFAGLSN